MTVFCWRLPMCDSCHRTDAGAAVCPAHHSAPYGTVTGALRVRVKQAVSAGDSRRPPSSGSSGAVPAASAFIPAARHTEQARLEAAVLQRVCAMGGLSEHPLGIVRVRPQADRLTLQLVDEPSVISHWIDFLHPKVSGDTGDDPRDRVAGVPRLRSSRDELVHLRYLCPRLCQLWPVASAGPPIPR